MIYLNIKHSSKAILYYKIYNSFHNILGVDNYMISL